MTLANCRHNWLVTPTSLVILKLMSEFMCFTLTNLNNWTPLERAKRLIGRFVLTLHSAYSITYTQDLCAVHPYIVGDEISMPPWWASPLFLYCFLFLSSVVADSSWMMQSHFPQNVHLQNPYFSDFRVKKCNAFKINEQYFVKVDSVYYEFSSLNTTFVIVSSILSKRHFFS